MTGAKMSADERLLKYLSRESGLALVDAPGGLKTIADAAYTEKADVPVYYMGTRMTLGQYLATFRGGGFPWQH